MQVLQKYTKSQGPDSSPKKLDLQSSASSRAECQHCLGAEEDDNNNNNNNNNNFNAKPISVLIISDQHLLFPVALLILFQMINGSVRNHVVKGFLRMPALKIEKSRLLAIQYKAACGSFCFHLRSSRNSSTLPTMINKKQSVQVQDLKVAYICTTHMCNSLCAILNKYLYRLTSYK